MRSPSGAGRGEGAELCCLGRRHCFGREDPRARGPTPAPTPPLPSQVAPNCLALCLKRFGLGRFSKINRRVAAGETLNLAPFMAEGAMDQVGALAAGWKGAPGAAKSAPPKTKP